MQHDDSVWCRYAGGCATHRIRPASENFES
jgi:hypothetical protein